MPLQKTITAKRVVRVLNDALVRDRAAISALVNNRVPIQEERYNGLGSSSSPIQVGLDNTVGMLGVINGLFGTNRSGFGMICAEYEVDIDGNLVSPLSITRFKILEASKKKQGKP